MKNYKRIILTFFISILPLSSGASCAWPGLVAALAGGSSSSGGGSGLALLLMGGGSSEKAVSGFEIAPATTSIAKDTTTDYTASLLYSDGSKDDVTASTTWSSSDPSVASIAGTGKATAVSAGTATITATFSGRTATGTITVTEATLESVQLTVSDTTMSPSTTRQLTLTGIFSDGSNQDLTLDPGASYTSANTGLITVNATGLMSSTASTGTEIVITGSYSGKSDTVTMKVVALSSIAIDPPSPSVSKGTSQQLTATATYSDSTTADVTTSVTWSIDNSSLGSVSNTSGSNGLLETSTASTTGSTTIRATIGSVEGTASLTVTSATLVSIAITPTNPAVARGVSKQFTATGTYTDSSTQNITSSVTWSSSNPTTVPISNSSGTEGKATTGSTSPIGETIITATSGPISGQTNLTITAAELSTISVTPGTKTVAFGTDVSYTATGNYTDGTTQNLTTQVTWTSSNTGVADISNTSGTEGKTTTSDPGSTTSVTITATHSETGKSGTATLTVTSVTLSSITVTPSNPSIAKGNTQQFTATGNYSDSSTQDLTSQVTWSSSSTGIATISNANGTEGKATGAGVGSSTISATFDGKTGSTTLTVTAAELISIAVSPGSQTVAVSATHQFTATGTYTDASSADITTSVTWSSSNTGVATISNAGGSEGLATGVATGTITVTATLSGKSATANLTVSGGTLSSISVTPINTTLAAGYTKQFTATGNYTDGSTKDLTSTVIWSSSSTSHATIDAAGVASALTGPATVTITATSGSISGSTTLNVSTASLSAITLSPISPSVANGFDQQFVATGHYSDGSTDDVTSQASWTSSNTSIVTMSGSTKGLAESVGAGSSTITATVGAVFANTTMTVTSETLQSISVTPASASISGIGTTLNMLATGSFSDGSTRDITSQVSWTSSSSSIAGINASGVVTSAAAGTTTITATSGSITDTASITVVTDTVKPTITSAVLADSALCKSGINKCLKVTFSESVKSAGATSTSNYKIATTVSGSCEAGTIFSGTTGALTIDSVTTLSSSEVIVNIDNGSTLSAVDYTLLGSTSIVDAADNALDCPNQAVFAGVDTTAPYMLTVTDVTPTSVVVRFSEAMKNTGGGTDDASVLSNYTITEVSSNTCTDPSITSINKVDERTYRLNLSSGLCNIVYKVNGATTLTDPYGNTLGSPAYLTFTGLERIKVVSAESLDTTHIKISFSKPLKASSAECSTSSACAEIYKISPASSLGNITSATVGSGSKSNTVTLVHATAQENKSYTVVVNNGTNDDSFDTLSTSKPVQDENGNNVQASPSDRATFLGTGTTTYDDFGDGTYFEDPFVDGTSFAYAFSFGGRIYLGTNDRNTTAFRFDPDGENAIQTTFSYSDGTCPGTDGFGYGTSPVCGTNSGPNGERGVVGFNSLTANVGGTDYEILSAGPIKDGVTHGYFTRDLDATLDWTQYGFSVTGGGNTKSIQNLYASGNYLYMGFSSTQGTQAPILSIHTITESGGNLTVGSGSDMSVRSLSFIGKGGGNLKNTSQVVGIDSIQKFGSALYIANNGGMAFTSDVTNFTSGTNGQYDPWTQGTGNYTLVLNSLEKIRPGQKGVPYLVEIGGKLYMARNVSKSTDGSTNLTSVDHGELWRCDDGDTDGYCESGEWTKIICGTESDLHTTNAISLLVNNNGAVYVGFDDVVGSNGLQVFKYNGTASALGAESGCNASMSTDWTQQGPPTGSKDGFGSSANDYIYSYATLSEGDNDYIYIVVGDASNPIKVFRQID